MKKAFKSRIFAFVLGAIIFSGITAVSAYTILANDIGYTPKDSTWKKSNGEDITNVKDAIDELYTKANNQKVATQVATLTTQGATYTMQNDGYITGTASRGSGNTMARLLLDDKMLALSNWESEDNNIYSVSVYAGKDTVVRTRSDGGTYNLTVYEWK